MRRSTLAERRASAPDEAEARSWLDAAPADVSYLAPEPTLCAKWAERIAVIAFVRPEGSRLFQPKPRH
jgi:hypothetical protein